MLQKLCHQNTSSKHRGINLDINIVVFIKDSFTNPQNPVVIIITSTNPRVINQYKKELIKILTKHNIITQVNIIQKKIDTGFISKTDTNQVNIIDNIITKYMLQSEQTLRHSIHSHSFSRKIAFTIIEVLKLLPTTG